MVDRPQISPGLLSLMTTANSEDVNIALDIPDQTIYLIGYRVEMSSAANALTEKVLYLEITGGVYNANRLLDNNVAHIYVPLFLDNAAVTLATGMNVPVAISRPIREKFTVRYLNSSFVPVSNFVSGAVQFSLERGHIS